jgi:FkbM family methyltransferase
MVGSPKGILKWFLLVLVALASYRWGHHAGGGADLGTELSSARAEIKRLRIKQEALLVSSKRLQTVNAKLSDALEGQGKVHQELAPRSEDLEGWFAGLQGKVRGVPALFDKLGVQSVADLAFVERADVESLPSFSPIQRRKLWAAIHSGDQDKQEPAKTPAAVSDAQPEAGAEAETVVETDTDTEAGTGVHVGQDGASGLGVEEGRPTLAAGDRALSSHSEPSSSEGWVVAEWRRNHAKAQEIGPPCGAHMCINTSDMPIVHICNPNPPASGCAVSDFEMRVYPAEKDTVISAEAIDHGTTYEVDTARMLQHMLTGWQWTASTPKAEMNAVLHTEPSIDAMLRCGHILEIGGNIGAIALPVSSWMAKGLDITRDGSACGQGPRHSVIAIEADVGNYWMLQDNIARNKLGGVAFALNRAAVDDEARRKGVCMSETADNQGGRFGWWQVLDENGCEKEHWTASISLDGLLERDPDLMQNVLAIKMDCEGCEPQALSGARKLLAAHPPCYIHFEGTQGSSFATGVSVLDAFKQLEDAGYEVAGDGSVGYQVRYRTGGGDLRAGLFETKAQLDAAGGAAGGQFDVWWRRKGGALARCLDRFR